MALASASAVLDAVLGYRSQCNKRSVNGCDGRGVVPLPLPPCRVRSGGGQAGTRNQAGTRVYEDTQAVQPWGGPSL